MIFVGVGAAFAGLVILNIESMNFLENDNVFWGNMITLLSSLFFAIQIVIGDYSLNRKKLDMITLTVVQVVSCAILMCLASVIFESNTYATLEINWQNAWWELLIVSMFGTAFAYFAQTYAQQHISPTEISIIMACESPIGAILAISIGDDKLTWSIVVGGLLVIAAVVIIEILPQLVKKRMRTSSTNTEDNTDTNSETEQLDDK